MAISLRYTRYMSYLADIIKKQVRAKLQYEGEIQRANQILETVPAKLEEADQEIQKAVQAAEILGERLAVAESIYGTYPDLDFTEFGLPKPQPVTEEEEDEPGTAVERIPAYEIEPVEVVDDIEEE